MYGKADNLHIEDEIFPGHLPFMRSDIIFFPQPWQSFLHLRSRAEFLLAS